MDKSYLVLTVLALTLTACGGKAAISNGNKFGPGGTYREVTDIQSCFGEADHPTIYKTWKRSFEGDNQKIDLQYQIFSSSRTRVKQTCHFSDGVNVEATVEVQSIVDEVRSKFAIKDSTNYTETVTSNGNQYSCTVSTQSFNAPYTFKGNCWGLIAGGMVTFFLPAQ